jgi:hypothetical protein
VTNDPLNCGVCGHGCEGANCIGGICQPMLLGFASMGDRGVLVISDGMLYAATTSFTAATRVYVMDPALPSTPMEIASGLSGLNSSISTALEGRLFWTPGYSLIRSCLPANCAGTMQTIDRTPWRLYPETGPVADRTTNELVWAEATDNPPGSSNYTEHRIVRSSPSFTNIRTLSTFSAAGEDSFNLVGFIGARSDRLFFTSRASSITTAYFISAAVTNATRQVIGSGDLVGAIASTQAFASDTLIVWHPRTDPLTYSAPLPGGIGTSPPPVFFAGPGNLDFGILDQQSFYGTVVSSPSIPADAIVQCPVTNCSSPTVLFTGQPSAASFIQHANSFYWTTPGPSGGGSGFYVWKSAK